MSRPLQIESNYFLSNDIEDGTSRAPEGMRKEMQNDVSVLVYVFHILDNFNKFAKYKVGHEFPIERLQEDWFNHFYLTIFYSILIKSLISFS